MASPDEIFGEMQPNDLVAEEIQTGFLGKIDAGLRQTYLSGFYPDMFPPDPAISEPFVSDYSGKPSINVLRLHPSVSFEKYGRFRNRAPKLAGKFAAEALLVPGRYIRGIEEILAVLDGGRNDNGMHIRYGVPVNIDFIAEASDHLGIEYSSASSLQSKIVNS